MTALALRARRGPRDRVGRASGSARRSREPVSRRSTAPARRRSTQRLTTSRMSTDVSIELAGTDRRRAGGARPLGRGRRHASWSRPRSRAIERLDPELNAFVAVCAERALAEADDDPARRPAAALRRADRDQGPALRHRGHPDDPRQRRVRRLGRRPRQPRTCAGCARPARSSSARRTRRSSACAP